MSKPKINILGCCVTRDTVETVKDNYTIGRYCAFISPYTMFAGKPFTVPTEKLRQAGAPGFAQRIISLDASSDTLNLLSDTPSDWLIIDLADIRMGVAEWPEHGVLLTYNSYVIRYLPIINEALDNENPKITQNADLAEDVLFERLEELLDKIVTVYDGSQIILNKFYNTFEFINSNDILVNFSKAANEKSEKANLLMKKAYEMCESKFKGCHVVQCPGNLIASAKHKWGLDPLHYHELYYDYAAKAFSVITEKHTQDMERIMLSDLCDLYTEKFATLREKAINNNLRADRNKWTGYSDTFKSLIIKDFCLNDNSLPIRFQRALVKAGYKSIAIYGDTEITKVLVHLLKNTDYHIDYIVESSSHPIDGILTVDKRDKTLPPTDVLLIADIYYLADVKNKLAKMGLPFPYYSAVEFIKSLPDI